MRRFCIVLLLTALFFGNANGQQVITGQVTCSCCNESVIGATVQTVQNKGTNIGATTGMDGVYRLEVGTLPATLLFRHINYDNKEVTVENDDILDVTLRAPVSNGPILRALVQDGQLLRIERTWDDRITGDFLYHILENTNFPEDAISQGIQGQIRVNFDVDRENNITNVQLREETNPLLDNEVLSVVRSAPKISNDEMHILRMNEWVWLGSRPADTLNIRRFTVYINFVITEIN